MAAGSRASGSVPMTDGPRISVRDLYKIFGSDPESMVDLARQAMGKAEMLEKHGHVLALSNINLDIRGRSIFVIMGLSGCGKSTLIRHFNRIIEPTSGSVKIDGRDVLDLSDSELRELRRREISMVFQRFALLPHRTVIANVTYGLSIQGVAGDEARSRAGKWIDEVGLTGFEDHYPNQLSGGMQQRVGLARALATDADILLMDEPFSALDPLIRADMQKMLLGLQAELSKTIIFITHDLDEALALGDGIAILRDGELVQTGDAQEIVLQPADAYVEDFVKNINRGRVIEVRSIMSPLDGSRPATSVAHDAVLEDALVTLTRENAKTARVVNGSGEAVGSVKLNEIVRAMAAPVRGGDGPGD
jgi:glycine betaine/proline transport system ATP-binding protein